MNQFMGQEFIYQELFKASLKFVSDTFVQIISNKNKSILEEKKNKKQNDENGIHEQSSIQLSESETLYGQLKLDTELADENIQNHIKEIERWAEIIKFSDLEKNKFLGSVYIQLDTFLLPAKKHLSNSERNRKIELESAVLFESGHCIILGQPGAGKTTSLKKICDLIIKGDKNINFSFPILLRLRDLGSIKTKNPILEHILKIIPLEFDFKVSSDSKLFVKMEEAKEEALYSLLNYIKPILILDGFDELKDFQTKEIVLNEVQRLANKLTSSKFVLSCRTGEFNSDLEHSNTYEIAPLNSNQIELFVHRWLKDEERSKDFLTKVKNSPFADTSIKPLSLAHLCTIYDRLGNIPDQPKTIYRKVVNLLIEEWDEQRSIIRISGIKGFRADQKFEFLTHLAYVLTTSYQASTFSISQFKTTYTLICEYHNLPKDQADEIVKELESHTGLFIESGYEKFEFVHKSIQEYLTAEYIVKLPSLNTITQNIELLGSELAIAVSISSDSSLYYIELILNYFLKNHLSSAFYDAFISRIISEKPSFKQNELVSVATLALISNWINPDNKRINLTKNLNIEEEINSSFFELSKSLNLREQRVKIFKYYKYSTGLHENKFVELIRIKVPDKHKKLPNKIYLPLEYYNEFN